MPGFVKTKKDEKIWQEARDREEKSRLSKRKKKGLKGKGKPRWPLVNHIFHQIKESRNASIALRIAGLLEE